MKQNELSERLNNWDRIGNYSRWMYHKYEAYIGKRVLDIGAGMGRMGDFYIAQCDKVVAADIFQSQVNYMNKKFEGFPSFKAEFIDIMTDDIEELEEQFDTVLCINVLEHLEDDELAVHKMKRCLYQGGNLVLFVPAWKKLYCQMDVNVNHYRRYDRGDLKKLAAKAEMDVIYNGYFNMMGIIPYYLKGKSNLKSGESFSSTLNEGNSKLYNIASKILEPIEKIVPPRWGLSEIIVLKKKDTSP